MDNWNLLAFRMKMKREDSFPPWRLAISSFKVVIGLGRAMMRLKYGLSLALELLGPQKGPETISIII